MLRSFSLFRTNIVVLFALIIVSLGHAPIVPSLQAQDSWRAQLTSSENHFISLDQAIKLVKNYRGSVPPASVLGEFFGRDAIQSLVNQADCIGARIYYGKNDSGTPVLVIVGVDASGQDMVNGLLFEEGKPCPPFCDTTKILGH